MPPWGKLNLIFTRALPPSRSGTWLRKIFTITESTSRKPFHIKRFTLIPMKPKGNIKKPGSMEKWSKCGTGQAVWVQRTKPWNARMAEQFIQERISVHWSRPGQRTQRNSKIYLYNSKYWFSLFKISKIVDNKWNWKIILKFRWAWNAACKTP